ncbi:OLC1v1004029C1 [Oldenlandia corymbosa var. corymbosa]|uniref:OLC1v1004029C1 n=1 Tax=Oldenlandia corymbosa var. corymbosa TaxID=529605 RepID=A0AAV1DEC7_OLDCO|nr:OLC1v1004029C1 [Oldenlandia corymbosa var. corymbosa]
MADSTTRSLPQHSIEEEEDSSSKIVSKPTDNIPIEIIPDEEMFLIEAAFASATRTFLPPLTQLQKNKGGRSITSISVLSKKRFSGVSGCGSIPVGDIEDSARDGIGQKKKKKIKSNETLLYQFRRKRGLAVTDLTATEWCEKQMEFILFRGKAKPTKAMKVGAARHAELEEEVVKKVPIQVTSAEDKWALRFINFIVGANQLLFEGLTRELPLVSFEKGLWIVGIIDEVRMPLSETETYATLVDTKTRVLARLPSAPQQRNGRLQLMCYKRLWDNLVADKFPSGKFFDFFVLNPHRILSSDIRECTAKSGFPAETLNDLVNFYLNSCRLLPPANTELLLRYELQEDQSLIGEDQFEYDGDWLDSQLTSCLEFWRGERDPHYAPEEERWKCRFCKFSSLCPVNADNGSLASTSSSTGG